MTMRQRASFWRAGLLSLLALGAGLVATPPVLANEPGVAQPQPALAAPAPNTSPARLSPGYQPAAGSLGFRLSETAIEEQLYRRAEGVLWGAQFASRWSLTEDPLDRWSAQAISQLADSLGPDVRLAGWERLDAGDLGDLRLAYRYCLATADGPSLGEATIVVFARGSQVGMSGAGTLGAGSSADALLLARALDADLSTRTLAAQVR
jgi:hypothetical protein